MRRTRLFSFTDPTCAALALCFITIFSIELHAQTSRHFTLQQAIDTGFTRDLKLASLGVQMEARSAAGKQIPLRRYPQLRYNAGASYAPSSPSFGYDPTVSNGGQLNAQVVATESLYDGGKRGIELQQSDLDYAHLERERGLEQADLKMQIVQAFTDVLHARESEALQDSSLHELSDYREVSRRLFAGGVVGQTDVLSVESQLKAAELSRDAAKAEEVRARFALAELLGAPSDTNFTLEGTLADRSHDAAVNEFEIDSTNNLELKIQQIELNKAELDVELARAGKRPTLDVVGDAGLLTSVLNLEQPTGNRSSVLGASVGIVLDGPLFDWGANSLLVDERSLEALNKKIEIAQLSRSLNAEYIRARSQLLAAEARIEPLKQARELAAKNYSLMLAKYAGGAARPIEVLEAHRQLIETGVGILDTEADIATLRATLERLTTK